MQLLSFNADNRDRIGVLTDDGAIMDIGSLLDDAPGDMIAFIREGGPMLERLAEATQTPGSNAKRYVLDDIHWHPPVRRPTKVVCLALNNRALDAIKIRAPTDHPAFFLKPCTALTGHLNPIRLRAAYGLTHPEPEIAVVIGRTLKDATPEAAMDGVYGYSIMNDVTSVGMREEDSFSVRYFKPGPGPGETTLGEAHTTYPGRYKASDTFAPLGPFLTTRDAVPDPADLKITCMLGDRLVAADHSKNYVWSIPDALSHISRTMTLLPGDVVSMGTAVGGDEDDADTPEVPGVTRANLNGFDGMVSVTISLLGTLTNPIEMI